MSKRPLEQELLDLAHRLHFEIWTTTLNFALSISDRHLSEEEGHVVTITAINLAAAHALLMMEEGELAEIEADAELFRSNIVAHCIAVVKSPDGRKRLLNSLALTNKTNRPG